VLLLLPPLSPLPPQAASSAAQAPGSVARTCLTRLKYEEEAKQRWGKSDVYKESQRRTKKYSEEDWKKVGAEQATIYTDAAVAKAAGKKPDDDDVMDIAERHRHGG
jgi:TipAS antibiotic-recognition protein